MNLLFHSPGFLFIFLPVFLLAIFVLPQGYPRSLGLLLCSYLFYSGSQPLFILLLVASSLTDYTAAIQIHGSRREFVRRFWLGVSIMVNLGLLGFYKYGGWVMPELAPYLTAVGIPVPSPEFFMGFILPAGISFYTFQSMAYTIDTWRGEIEPERNLLGFCNYVAYLPQLIAGPIERFAHLGPQLHRFVWEKGTSYWSAGLDRIVLGIAQKLLIADSCGLIVDRLLSTGGGWDFFRAWGIALGFGMQIYYDFAAYTHMAIGIALLMGVRLRENFLSPYKAVSIQDFWRRWHVTLSRWFRDYVYFPLGGSRSGSVRTLFNILLTFLLCGLWHGAGWNFVLWGALHGLALGIYHLKKSLMPNWVVTPVVAIAITFVLIHFFWVPFRVDNIVQIVSLWQAMIGLNGFELSVAPIADLGFLSLVVAGTLLLPNAASRWPGCSGWKESTALATIALFAVFNSPAITAFIYFQF
ncbi:MAG: alginate O-acetyltransferase complex protein AlgI [Parasphingorhabdus sp.]